MCVPNRRVRFVWSMACVISAYDICISYMCVIGPCVIHVWHTHLPGPCGMHACHVWHTRDVLRAHIARVHAPPCDMHTHHSVVCTRGMHVWHVHAVCVGSMCACNLRVCAPAPREGEVFSVTSRHSPTAALSHISSVSVNHVSTWEILVNFFGFQPEDGSSCSSWQQWMWAPCPVAHC